jgi:tetratricopeptide (TPR) repeat protein
LYETVADYKNAEMAYRFAIEKAKIGYYKPYYKLICVLLAQDRIDEAEDVLNSIKDLTDLDLIKFKTRSNIVLGDKYYSIGKFISSAKAYERANFYYSKLTKNDKKVVEAIKNRIINSLMDIV